jgi:hypothetical protein
MIDSVSLKSIPPNQKPGAGVSNKGALPAGKKPSRGYYVTVLVFVNGVV